jgi:hypothetical protein
VPNSRAQVSATPRVVQLAPDSSIGIRNYAQNLSAALSQLGIHSHVEGSPTANARQPQYHYHFGNSTRRGLLWLATTRQRCVVTIHDVVPRNRRLRKGFARWQIALLGRHILIVHSQYAADMVRRLNRSAGVHIVHHGTERYRIPDLRRTELRAQFSPRWAPLLLTAGILKQAKGVAPLIDAARANPDLCFVFAGRPADKATRMAFATAPPNCHFVDTPADDLFRDLIATADYVTNFRTESVGEVSGPVTIARGCGTGIIGYDVGFMREYCGPQDALFPPELAVTEVLNAFQRRVDRSEPSAASADPPTYWREAAVRTAAIYQETWPDIQIAGPHR